jgi:hypothetical protein
MTCMGCMTRTVFYSQKKNTRVRGGWGHTGHTGHTGGVGTRGSLPRLYNLTIKT